MRFRTPHHIVALALVPLAACDSPTVVVIEEVTLEIEPTSSLFIGIQDTIRFMAVARDSAENTVNATITWRSSDTSVVSIGLTSGLATAKGNGTAWLRAEAVALSGAAHGEDSVQATVDDPIVDANLVEFDLRVLSAQDVWLTGYGIKGPDDYPHDSTGLKIDERDGQVYYTPHGLARYGAVFFDNFRRTGDVAYLDLSMRHADKLLAEGHVIDDALYFPYHFDFPLHASPYPEDLMVAPWYTGMDQGEALSLFVRLYEYTGEERYLEAAHDVFATFTRLRSGYRPFTAELDAEGYYWIAEYPLEAVRDETLNGFVYGTYGLYEYWVLTRRDLAKRLVNASLSTLRRYIYDYRVPGGVSYYCLGHRVQLIKYHLIHIRQLRHLWQMSGDTYFGVMADLFEEDISNSQAGKVMRSKVMQPG